MRLRPCVAVLIVFAALVSPACAPRGDWISETLTLVNVTGTWHGTVRYTGRLTCGSGPGSGPERSIRLVLVQKGARVTGKMEGTDAGKVDGVVTGEVLAFERLGRLKGSVTIDGDEMSGSFDGYACPCCPSSPGTARREPLTDHPRHYRPARVER